MRFPQLKENKTVDRCVVWKQGISLLVNEDFLLPICQLKKTFDVKKKRKRRILSSHGFSISDLF
jgi:hypothetical protein